MTEEIDLVACLVAFQPGAEWKIDNNDYSSLEWYSDSNKPTLKQLQDCWSKVLEDKKAEADKIIANAAAKAALLERLGITADEAKLLLA